MAKRTAVTILRGVLKLVKRGWVQNDYFKEKEVKLKNGSTRIVNCFCLSGALSFVDSDGGITTRDEEGLSTEGLKAALLLAGLKRSKLPLNKVIQWNDKRGRTQAEVIERVEAAIETAKQVAA
jgi:hypothetical protein